MQGTETILKQCTRGFGGLLAMESNSNHWFYHYDGKLREKRVAAY